MSHLAVPFFHSATILAQRHAASTTAEVVPWRRILAVEPDIAVLNAGALLLTKANFCVTLASSDNELFILRHTRAIALAILSDRLGQRLLGMVAATVRRQWPRTRILILGKAPPVFEDHLYDEQMDRSSDPKQVVADLEKLYDGMWNQRSNSLDWDATRSARCFARPLLAESDPTKDLLSASIQAKSLRDTPSDLRIPAMRRS